MHQSEMEFQTEILKKFEKIKAFSFWQSGPSSELYQSENFQDQISISKTLASMYSGFFSFKKFKGSEISERKVLSGHSIQHLLEKSLSLEQNSEVVL